MAYSTGLLDKRIKILNRTKAQKSRFGLDAAGVEWEEVCTVWASVDWAKGMRTLNAGAIDAYGVVLVRMRWCPHITMRSRIVYDGQTYQVLPETFHPDKQGNTIQFNAQVIVND